MKRDITHLLDGRQEAYGFKVGDLVEHTNDAGIKFGPRRVLGFRTPKPDFLPRNVVYIDDDCPWFPVRPESLRKMEGVEDPDITKMRQRIKEEFAMYAGSARHYGIQCGIR